MTFSSLPIAIVFSSSTLILSPTPTAIILTPFSCELRRNPYNRVGQYILMAVWGPWWGVTSASFVLQLVCAVLIKPHSALSNEIYFQASDTNPRGKWEEHEKSLCIPRVERRVTYNLVECFPAFKGVYQLAWPIPLIIELTIRLWASYPHRFIADDLGAAQINYRYA